MTPAGTSNELDVQNEWEENTNTHTASQRTVSTDGLLDRIVTIVSSTWVLASCVVGVRLGCISVVPTTVRESATPDSKGNKQADAGSRLFSKISLCGALL